MCKIYSRITNNTLKVTADNIITEEQMEFRQGHSTVNNFFIKTDDEERRELN